MFSSLYCMRFLFAFYSANLYNIFMSKNQMINLIAEFGCNHCGSIDLAVKMIDLIASLGVDSKIQTIKFQKRTPELVFTEDVLNSPHPNLDQAFGSTYLEHRRFLEFDLEQHRYLKSFIESKGLNSSCSVFDKESLKQILSLNPKMIKLSAVNNTDSEILKILDSEFDGEIHISLGMTDKEEEKFIVKNLKNKFNNTVFYACTTDYPVQVGDICLLEVQRLKQTYGNEIKGVGFSAHHIGIVQDIASLALGATYFERHFTSDKTLKGADQFMSLDISEFAQLAKNLRMVAEDLKFKTPDILDSEIAHRIKHNKKQVLICQ